MKTVMLIDDDKDMSHLTKIALIKEGYKVIVCHDSHSGLENLKKQKTDLILMDMILPGMSGAEAVKYLKTDSQFKDIRVIFLTALVSNEEKTIEETGLAVDGVRYRTLGKPYEIEKLLEVVKNALH